MRKTRTHTTQTNTYGWMTPPSDSPDTVALREHIMKAYDTPDPTIAYDFARRRERVLNRIGNPFGPNYSPEVADAIRYNDLNELDQEQAHAMRLDRFNRRQAKTAALASLAGHTAPRLVQTGGSGTSFSYQPFNWGRLISPAAQIGMKVI